MFEFQTEKDVFGSPYLWVTIQDPYSDSYFKPRNCRDWVMINENTIDAIRIFPIKGMLGLMCKIFTGGNPTPIRIRISEIEASLMRKRLKNLFVPERQ